MRAFKFSSGFALLYFALACLALSAATTVGTLRCELLENPLGIDASQPRLSWILESEQANIRQSAWQILVASSAANLARGTGDLWDSGRVASDQSHLLPYAGHPLATRQECFWKVRVWDQDGQPSPWSEPAHWSMGVLDPGTWHARWIGFDGNDERDTLSGTSWIWYPEGVPQVAAPVETVYFRRVISLPSDRHIKRAIFQFTGDNECHGWIDQIDLGACSDTKTVCWNDVTTRIDPRQPHVLCLEGHNTGTNANPAGAIALLTIEFTDGETLAIQTGDQWKVSKSAPKDWHSLKFDDSHWANAKLLGPTGMEPWGETRVPEDRRQPARYLRKQFSLDQPVARATVSFCGLGLSELYLNGAKVGDAVLSPAFSQYDKRQYYVTYDLTTNLQSGPNALSVILGNGRFYGDRSHNFSGTPTFGWPKLLLNLHIDFADGSSREIVSDDSWQLTTSGPIRANNDYDGEEYDARMEMPGWDRPGFDVSQFPGWQDAQLVTAPDGVLAAQMMPPIRVTGTRRPVSVKELRPGIFVYDLGQNIAGWCRLHVHGPAGAQIILRHAETLRPDGSLYFDNLRGAEVTDYYTLRGDAGLETWEPRFITHGFRYVEVSGFPGTPGLDSLEGRVVNDDLPVTGSFLCSNELLNRIYTNIVWGTRGNFRSMPTDCPQRDERQGWLGDRAEECQGESYFFDTAPLYVKWRQDMADAQRPDGNIPDVAPALWSVYSDNVTWPSTAIIVPAILYRQFGDSATLAKNYPGAKTWINHMLAYATNNLIARDSYGDWCVPPEGPSLIHSQDPARQTDPELLATAYFYYDLCLMELYARLLNNPEDTVRWHQLAADFKSAFNQKFLDRSRGRYANGTQTSCILPLALGLVPDEMRSAIFGRLVDKIEDNTGGHIGTGLIGGQFLNRVLSDNGRPDLAYTIATKKDYPGWGYMVRHGATTVWELWNGNTADPGMNSGNHVMLVGDLVTWLYEDLAGIAPDDAQPGFKHIIMQPRLVDGLAFVKATHQSPYGLISSEWHRRARHFDWQIVIPANATATVFVPARSADAVSGPGARTAHFANGLAAFELGSGHYHFSSLCR